jgi:hypothetical protein
MADNDFNHDKMKEEPEQMKTRRLIYTEGMGFQRG